MVGWGVCVGWGVHVECYVWVFWDGDNKKELHKANDLSALAKQHSLMYIE